MAGETIITVVGNLTGDPELRFTQSGQAVANCTIASTPRTFNKQTNEWEDGETLFMRTTVWREAAENVAESLGKGQRVIAQGRLKARTFETREGEKRTVMELEADEIGPSLRYATAQVRKSERGQGGSSGQGGFSGQGQPQGQGGAWGGQGGGQPAPQGQGGFNGYGYGNTQPPQGQPPQGQGQPPQGGQPQQGDVWNGGDQGWGAPPAY